MYDVTPFKPSFRVYDKDTKAFTGDVFDCPIEARNFIYDIAKHTSNHHYNRSRISYTLRLEPDFTYQVWVSRSYRVEEAVYYGGFKCRSPRDIYVTKSVPAANHCIIDNFGHVITEADINAAIAQRWLDRQREAGKTGWHWRDHREEQDKRLLIIKGSPSKLKRTYGTRRIGSWGGNYLPHEASYENEITSYQRVPHCQQERRVNEGHENEYGQSIVRASRRGRFALPSSYDDMQCQAWGQRKCWKHNSKRRKQWVPK